MINTKEQHEAAIAQLNRLMALDPEPGSLESIKLIALASSIERYENSKFKFKTPSHKEMKAFRRQERKPA